MALLISLPVVAYLHVIMMLALDPSQSQNSMVEMNHRAMLYIS